jgi:hypothetical protein
MTHRLREGRPPGCDHLPSDLFADDWVRDLDTVVECLHCGCRFPLGDAVWVPLAGDPIVAGLWSCPQVSACGGTLIDFIPVRRRRRRDADAPPAPPAAGLRGAMRRTGRGS